jgi:Uma2 family endonuclease
VMEHLHYKFKQIMEDPHVIRIIREAMELLTDEQRRRLQFYEDITEDDKAEFVNGEVIFQSPVMKAHNDATGNLYVLLQQFSSLNNLGFVGVEKILTQFTRNDYEPDICYFHPEKAADFKSEQLLFPIPDFIAKVLSKSSAKIIQHDTVTKFNDYEAHGVSEYWIIDPHEETVAQYCLVNRAYELQAPSQDGMLHSSAIPGFSIPLKAIFDRQTNLQVMRSLLQKAM